MSKFVVCEEWPLATKHVRSVQDGESLNSSDSTLTGLLCGQARSGWDTILSVTSFLSDAIPRDRCKLCLAAVKSK